MKYIIIIFAAVSLCSCQSYRKNKERATIESKFNSIVFPKIEYDELELLKVFQDLEKRSVQHDPEKTGIKFFMSLSKVDLSKYRNDDEYLVSREFTICGENVGLHEVVKFLCMIFSCEYIIIDEGVLIKPISEESPVIQDEDSPIFCGNAMRDEKQVFELMECPRQLIQDLYGK